MKNSLAFLVFFMFVLSIGFAQKSVYRTETLEIIQLTESSFVHISYLTTNDFGRVACNGLVVIDGKEAMVLDTPVDDPSAEELLLWIKTEKDANTIGVVATHFHNDCLGGLSAFHKQGIPSFASQVTVDLAKENDYEVPKSTFSGEKEIEVGEK